MADEEKKEEEVIVEEETKQEESVDKAPEIPEKVTKVQDAFDAKLDEDDDEENSVEDDKTSGDDDDSTGDKDADDKTEEDDPGTDDSAKEEELSAEDKEIAEAAKQIEEEAAANAGKTDAQKQAEKLAEEQKAKNEAEAAEKAKEADKYVSDLDPEEWDNATIEMDTKRGQQNLDAQKALKEQNDALQAQVQQQANQRHADWLDTKFNSLGEDFTEAVGDGEYIDLEPGSVQAENRVKIGNRMYVLSIAYQKQGKEVPTRNKLFKRAVSDVLPKIVNKKKTDKETAKKLAERKEQVMGKGSKKASKIARSTKALQIQKDFDALLDEDD
jgi:hypothetical protein